MAERKFVKPATGADGKPFVTINPATGRPLSEQGEWVDLDRTTRRRLRDGDWVDDTPPENPRSNYPPSHEER